MENKLTELGEMVLRMEKENDALFEQLGISPHQVQEILNDKTRFSPETFEFIQKERQALEDLLERRLDAVRKGISPKTPKIGGHWIFVR